MSVSQIRLVTWNVNSIRSRLDHLARFITETKPDILCLQETKVEDSKMPEDALIDAGLPHLHYTGGKAYQGVLIASRYPIEKVDLREWAGKQDHRYVAVTVDTASGPVTVHNFYIPAGGDIPDRDENPKFDHKMTFMQELADWGAAEDHDRHILVGDLNIAPLESDVWSHKQLLKVVSHTPIEVEAFDKAQQAGEWVDAVREIIPAEEKLYSWWSYRSPKWETSDKGRRLDHVWIGQGLKDMVKHAEVYKEARRWEKPSDHAPIIVDFAF